MRFRYGRTPQPVHAKEGYSSHFPEKWLAHHKRQRDARTWKRFHGEVSWVRLPPRRDPVHPRGLLVGSSRTAPGLRAYLGFEAAPFEPIWRPAHRFFLDATFSVPHRADCKWRELGDELRYRRTLKGGLRPLVRQAETWFICREDSYDDHFATPDTDFRYRRKR